MKWTYRCFLILRDWILRLLSVLLILLQGATFAIVSGNLQKFHHIFLVTPTNADVYLEIFRILTSLDSLIHGVKILIMNKTPG